METPSDQTPEVYLMEPPNPPKGWRREMGLTAFVGDELFIPAGAAGLTDDLAVVLAGCDGVRLVCAEGHVLIPETWARKEHHAGEKVYDVIRGHAVAAREKAKAGEPQLVTA